MWRAGPRPIPVERSENRKQSEYEKNHDSALDIRYIAGKMCEAVPEYDHIVNANDRLVVPTIRTFAFDVRSLKNKISRVSWPSRPEKDLEHSWSIALICTEVLVE